MLRGRKRLMYARRHELRVVFGLIVAAILIYAAFAMLDTRHYVPLVPDRNPPGCENRKVGASFFPCNP